MFSNKELRWSLVLPRTWDSCPNWRWAVNDSVTDVSSFQNSQVCDSKLKFELWSRPNFNCFYKDSAIMSSRIMCLVVFQISWFHASLWVLNWCPLLKKIPLSSLYRTFHCTYTLNFTFYQLFYFYFEDILPTIATYVLGLLVQALTK